MFIGMGKLYLKPSPSPTRKLLIHHDMARSVPTARSLSTEVRVHETLQLRNRGIDGDLGIRTVVIPISTNGCSLISHRIVCFLGDGAWPGRAARLKREESNLGADTRGDL